MRNKIKPFFVITIFLSLLLFSFSQISFAKNEGQIDAIGVRVVPNPNNHSISYWYQEQGFYGSPQALIVDGYEAIRDGRTVYVNAANVSGKSIHTNIYIISYNQEPSEKTIDILGQIVSRWKFNNNLENIEEEEPSCSISSLACDEDEDCANGSKCSKEDNISKGSCVLSEEVNCRIDSDCPSGFFCDSVKSKITRDIKRVGLLAELKNALNNYFRNKGNYPLLSSGTYLSNHSISLWPSWKNNFLLEVVGSPTLIDPINRLGYCPGYDKETCWNIEDNAFYSSAAETLSLPEGSYALAYSTNQEGSSYNLCAVLESRHPRLNYSFPSNQQEHSSCVTDMGIVSGGSSNNLPPYLVEYNLSGETAKEFNGFIKVYDENNDPLSWKVSRAGGDWSSWSSDFPKILNTSNKFQKKIYGQRAGAAGSYPISLNINDGRGGVLDEILNIEINDLSVFIEAENAYHVLNKQLPFKYSVYVSGENFADPSINNNISIEKVSGGAFPNLFVNKEVELVSNNRYKISYSGEIDPDVYKFPENTDFEFKVTARNEKGVQFEKNFFLYLISEKPPLNFSCPLSTRATKDYSCLIGKSVYLGNDVLYGISGQPESLTLETQGEGSTSDVLISGKADITSADKNLPHRVLITAQNDYGAVSSKSYDLLVNTSCGDGYKQNPNSEERGGIYNDGREQCDGLDGITNNPLLSNIDLQYACTTNSSTKVPVEIVTKDFCIFKGPLSGGGYCGDGFCQTAYENGSNCPGDCGGSEVPPVEIDDDPIVEGCRNNEDCDDGYYCDDGTCKIKCWQREEIILQRFFEGETLIGDTYVYKDNPNCTDSKKYTKIGQSPNPSQVITPPGYSSVRVVGMTGDKDTCRASRSFYHLKHIGSNFVVTCGNPPIGKKWCPRYIYEAKKVESVLRCFGKPCRPTSGSEKIDGTMNSNGQCIKNPATPRPPLCKPCSQTEICTKFERCIDGCCVRDGLIPLPRD